MSFERRQVDDIAWILYNKIIPITNALARYQDTFSTVL